MSERYLTATEAREIHGIPAGWLRRYRSRRCPVLGNRPIRTRGNGRAGNPRRYYEPDLQKLAAVPPLEVGTVQIGTEEYVTATEAERRTGLASLSVRLGKFRRGVRRSLRRIAHRRHMFRTEQNLLREVWVYRWADVCGHLATMESAATEAEPEWFPIAQAAPSLGVRHSAIAGWRWREFCPMLGRKARIEKRVAPDKRGRWQEQLCIHRNDKRLLEQALTPQNTGAVPRDSSPWIPAARAAPELGVAINTMCGWHQRGHCPPLGRKARIEKRRVQNQRGRWQEQLCIHLDDKRQIQEKLQGSNSAEYASAYELAKRLKKHPGVIYDLCERDSCWELGGRAVETRTVLRRLGCKPKWRSEATEFKVSEVKAVFAARARNGFDDRSLHILEEAARTLGFGYSAKKLARVVRGESPSDPLHGVFQHRKRPGIDHYGRQRQLLAVTQEELDEAMRRLRGGEALETPTEAQAAMPAAEVPLPPRRRGRPKQTERDICIRRRAKEENLMDAPAELTRRLNADTDFVSLYGEVTKPTIRTVLHRAKRRAQKS